MGHSKSVSRATEAATVERVGTTAYALHLWLVVGLALSNLAGLVAVAAAATLRPSLGGRGRAVLLPAAIYAVCVLLAIVFSTDPTASLDGASELLSLLTLPLGILFASGSRNVRSIADGLIIMGAFASTWGLFQLFFGYGGIDQRIVGPFSHWMTFAGVLLMADLLVVAQLLARRRSRTAWRWIALLVINLGLVACLTRGAWVAGALSIAVLILLSSPRWLAAWVSVAALGLVLAPSPVRDRVASISDLGNFSNYDRLCMLEAGWLMTRERPIFGHGPDRVRDRYPIYRHETAPRHWVPHLHNNFAQISAESGLPSALAVLWMMAVAAWTSWRRYRRERASGGEAADLYLGALGALLAFNLAGLFEFNWGDTEVQRLALFAVAMPFCLAGEKTS